MLVICGRNVAEIAKGQQESWEAMPLEAHMAHPMSLGHRQEGSHEARGKDRGVKEGIYTNSFCDDNNTFCSR